MKRALLVAALPLLLLAACVTTGGREVDLKEAAKDNVALGAHYLRSGNLQTAKDKLERAEKQDPQNPEVYWTQALLNEQLNLPVEAERSYQKALKLAPNSLELANTYASFLCKQGQIDRALPLFDRVIADRLYSQPYVAATNAGICLRGEKRNADALRYLERAAALGPGYSNAVVELADLQLVQGNPEGARKAFETYTSGGNKSPEVYLVGVRAVVVLRDCPAAQLYARLLRRDFPNSAQASTLPQVLSTCVAATN